MSIKYKILTFDVGGSSTKIAIINENQEFIERDKIEYPNNELIDATNLWPLIIHKVIYFKNKYKLDAICISSCGIIAEDGTISGFSAIQNYEIINWKKDLKEFGLPIYVENDGNCSLLAEYHYGVAKNYSTVFSLVLGTGIGGAIIVNNRLIKGWAGEFGCFITQLTSKNEYVDFSNQASPRNVEILLNKLTNRTWKLSEYLKDYEINSVIKNIIDSTLYEYAKIIINISFVIPPELVIIGGGISENEWFINKLQTEIKKLAKKCGFKLNWNLVGAQFKNDANLLGAYSLYKRR